MQSAGGLDEALSQATATMRKLWDQIGLAQADRAAEEAKLLARISQVLEQSVVEQQQRVADLQQQIQQVVQHTAQLRAALGDKSAIEAVDTSMPLLATLARVEATDKAAAQLYQQQKQQFDQAAAKLKSMLDLLGTTEGAGRSACVVLDSDLTATRYEAMLEQTQIATQEIANRKTAIAAQIQDIVRLWEELEMQPSSEFEVAVANSGESIGLTCDTIDKLSALANSLVATKRDREARLKQYATQICILWEKLSVSEDEREMWLSQHASLSENVLLACAKKQQELKMELQIKLGSIIGDHRAAIKELWAEMYYSQEARLTFSDFQLTPEHFDEAVLDAHVAYLDGLKEELERRRPILKLIERYIGMVAEREEYDAMISDSSRLLNRGHSKPGQRLREERLEKRVKKELPAVIAKLQASLAEWAESSGSYFVYEGKAFETVIEGNEAEYEARLDARRADKARDNDSVATHTSSAAAPPRTPGKTLKKVASAAVFTARSPAPPALPDAAARVAAGAPAPAATATPSRLLKSQTLRATPSASPSGIPTPARAQTLKATPSVAADSSARSPLVSRAETPSSGLRKPAVVSKAAGASENAAAMHSVFSLTSAAAGSASTR